MLSTVVPEPTDGLIYSISSQWHQCLPAKVLAIGVTGTCMEGAFWGEQEMLVSRMSDDQKWNCIWTFSNWSRSRKMKVNYIYGGLQTMRNISIEVVIIIYNLHKMALVFFVCQYVFFYYIQPQPTPSLASTLHFVDLKILWVGNFRYWMMKIQILEGQSSRGEG